MSTEPTTPSAWIVGEYVDQLKSACPHCWAVQNKDASAVDTRIDPATCITEHLVDGQWVACPISKSWAHKLLT